MGTKLGKKTYPSGHGPNDFQCFGPPATEDDKFENVKIADLGCFTQDDKDTNKQYHAAIVKSKQNGQWYVYFEWGRTGSTNPDYQFVECSSEADAQKEFVKQLKSKNVKRGEWVNVGGKTRLRAKAGKDCYLVRPQATRSTGLPDAKSIVSEDVPVKNTATKKKSTKKASVNYDRETIQLMQDMNVATVSYTRQSMTGGALPTQSAIDEARDLLIEAQTRVAKVGDDLNHQVADNELRQLTYELYGRIPKIKRVGAAESTWILSKDNIFGWNQDLDAYESALHAQDIQVTQDADPFGGMRIKMEHLAPHTDNWEFVANFMHTSTRNVHGNVGRANIKHIWSVTQMDLDDKFLGTVRSIGKVAPRELPLFQPKSRADLSSAERKTYKDSNVALLWHGSRSVNVPGILRTGLRLPKQLVGVTITGALLGQGAYFADDWKKSAGYCSLNSSYWAGGSGSVKGRSAFMFLMDVALGMPHTAKESYGYTKPPRGCHSVFGKADATKCGGWGYLKNNEWVIYDTNQHNIKYLIEFSA